MFVDKEKISEALKENSQFKSHKFLRTPTNAPVISAVINSLCTMDIYYDQKKNNYDIYLEMFKEEPPIKEKPYYYAYQRKDFPLITNVNLEVVLTTIESFDIDNYY